MFSKAKGKKSSAKRKSLGKPLPTASARQKKKICPSHDGHSSDSNEEEHVSSTTLSVKKPTSTNDAADQKAKTAVLKNQSTTLSGGESQGNDDIEADVLGKLLKLYSILVLFYISSQTLTIIFISKIRQYCKTTTTSLFRCRKGDKIVPFFVESAIIISRQVVSFSPNVVEGYSNWVCPQCGHSPFRTGKFTFWNHLYLYFKQCNCNHIDLSLIVAG